MHAILIHMVQHKSSMQCSTWTMFSLMHKPKRHHQIGTCPEPLKTAEKSAKEKGLISTHSQWWSSLFAKLCVGSLRIILFFMEVSGRRQMQYYNTVNKCVYRNKSNVESVNSICYRSQLCQKRRNLFTYFITCYLLYFVGSKLYIYHDSCNFQYHYCTD